MIKHSIFANKHLPVQTQRNKHQQRILDLFKLLNKDYSTNLILVVLLSLFDIILLGTLVLLLFIPHAKWYNVGKNTFSNHSTTPYPTLE